MTSAFHRCRECGVDGLGDDALANHRWRRHTREAYRETFGRRMPENEAVRWDELPRAAREAAIEQRHRTLAVLGW